MKNAQGILKEILYEEAPCRGTTPLTLLNHDFFYRKGTPFLIPTDKWYPFHKPSSERNASLLTAVNAPSF